jgi:hypothetical protein
MFGGDEGLRNAHFPVGHLMLFMWSEMLGVIILRCALSICRRFQLEQGRGLLQAPSITTEQSQHLV